MLLFSTKVRQIIADGKGRVFFFLHITNGDGSLFRASTTHHSPFTMANGITYLADDYIIGVDAPQLTTTVDREQYKITLADPDFSNAAAAESGLIGKKLEARLGFIDPDTGLPLSAMEDSFVVYKGRIDGMGATINTEEIGESTFVMSCASPMVSLDMKKGVYLSRDFVRSRNAADASCDKIYNGSGALVLKWGKA